MTNQSTSKRPLAWALLFLCATLLLASGALLQRGRLNRNLLQLNSALASGQSGRIDEALAELNAITPKTQAAWRGIAIANMAQKRLDEAATAWLPVKNYRSEVVAWGIRAERAGEWEEARDWFHVATQLEPNNGDHWYRLAGAAVALQDEAAGYYERALAAPDRLLFGRSNILTRLGQLERNHAEPNWNVALRRFNEAIEQDEFVDVSDVVVAWQGKAEALERLGQMRAALDAYEWLAAEQPGHYWANVHSGRLTWYVDKDAATAERYLQRAIAINDEPKWAYLYLGVAYAGSGQPALAVPLFEKVLALDPGDPTARQELEKLAIDDQS